MAVEWENGVPILTNDSLLSDVPAYTQEVAGLLGGDSIPIGTIIAYALDPAPLAPEWLSCNGTVVDPVAVPEHQDLYDALGTTFGAAGQLPSFIDRVVVGAGVTYANGATGGAATHTLTVNEMPSHAHAFHDMHVSNNGRQYMWPQGPAHPGASSIYGQVGSWDVNQSGQIIRNDFSSAAIMNNGHNWAHNNMQPYMAVYYIIKAV